MSFLPITTFPLDTQPEGGTEGGVGGSGGCWGLFSGCLVTLMTNGDDSGRGMRSVTSGGNEKL